MVAILVRASWEYAHFIVSCTAKQILPAKKKLNIPTPIVLTVEEYDKFLSDSYRQPTAYVKHTKKLHDEADPSIDYVAEPDDQVQNRVCVSELQTRDLVGVLMW